MPWGRIPRTVWAAVAALPVIAAAVVLLPQLRLQVRDLRLERPAFLNRLKADVRARAMIEVEDDFHAGLSGWRGESGAAGGWSYDPAGFVRPRRLALLGGSMPLANYRLQFLGLIEKKSLGWVFRASDARNYYAMKITIAKPGPLPRGAIVRYVVVNGVATDRVEFPLPLAIRNNTIYRVETNVWQDRFVTSVNGRVVDTFFDQRHPAGGVGLFSGTGEDWRVWWVRVADRDDLMGRMCLYLSRLSTDSRAEAPAGAAPRR